MGEGTFRIGELAVRTGLTRDTLRYYERRGLFPKPPRTAGGYRRYPAATLDRVIFIKRAQALGLSLDEVRELATYNGRGGLRRCRRVLALLVEKLRELDETLAELRALRNGLRATLSQCERAIDTGDATACPIIERPRILERQVSAR